MAKKIKERERCDDMQNNHEWYTCGHCGKRLHNENCTSKRNREKDCFCKADGITNTPEYLKSFGISPS